VFIVASFLVSRDVLLVGVVLVLVLMDVVQIDSPMPPL
jgi:hypothetical protein